MVYFQILVHILGRTQDANTGVDNLGISPLSTSSDQSKTPKSSMLPFPRDPDFVGRELLLKTMFERKEAKKQNEQLRIALLGMGGVG